MSVGSIIFNKYLIDDISSKYWLYFSDNFDSASALIINDSGGVPITGVVSGRTSVSFTFDYTGNTQGGRTPNTDCPYIAVGIGMDEAKYVVVTGIINSGISNTINLITEIDWNWGSSGGGSGTSGTSGTSGVSGTGKDGTSGSSGKDGEIGSLNLDGGHSGTQYGGTTRINGGTS